MTTLTTDELLLVLRSLHFYEEKLTNVDDEYQNMGELIPVTLLRTQLGNCLKFEARID